MKINELEINEGINDKYIFKAVFTAGGPGSGKSFVSKKLFAPYGFREVNVDRFIEYFGQKQSLDTKRMQDWDSGVFVKAKKLTNKSFDLYIDGRLPLLIDGTGRKYQKIVDLSEKLKSLGYDTGLLFVNTSLETAKKRNQNRERVVPIEFLEKAWQQVQANIGIFQDYFDENMIIVDNDVDSQPNWQQVNKRIERFINSPVNNTAAKRWMEEQKKERKIAA